MDFLIPHQQEEEEQEEAADLPEMGHPHTSTSGRRSSGPPEDGPTGDGRVVSPVGVSGAPATPFVLMLSLAIPGYLDCAKAHWVP